MTPANARRVLATRLSPPLINAHPLRVRFIASGSVACVDAVIAPQTKESSSPRQLIDTGTGMAGREGGLRRHHAETRDTHPRNPPRI
jgi:hypothetical protein